MVDKDELVWLDAVGVYDKRELCHLFTYDPMPLKEVERCLLRWQNGHRYGIASYRIKSLKSGQIIDAENLLDGLGRCEKIENLEKEYFYGDDRCRKDQRINQVLR